MTTPTPRSNREWRELAEQAQRELAAAQMDAKRWEDAAEALRSKLAAAQEKIAQLETENSKLRSALELVHFKQEPWQ